MAASMEKLEDCPIFFMGSFKRVPGELLSIPYRVCLLDCQNSIFKDAYSLDEYVEGSMGPTLQAYLRDSEGFNLLHTETVHHIVDGLPDYPVHPQLEAWRVGFATLEGWSGKSRFAQVLCIPYLSISREIVLRLKVYLS